METQTQGPGIAYRYGALKYAKSIRLLYLHTGDSYHQLPIEISLREFPIDALPSFGALSYTWATEDGLASLSQELLCGGASIKITKNCEAALKRLRRPREDQVLWVDAVCIDQSNVEERSLQIGLMRQIYSQASWVALWLGEPSLAVDEESGLPLSDLGMDYIHDFAVEIAEKTNSGQDPGEGPLYQEFIKDRMAFQYSNSEVFTPRVRGLWDVLHRSWWKRLWVVQEVALSRQPTLICGSKGEPFHNVKVVIEALIRPQQAVEVMEYNSLFIASTFHQFHVRHMIETGGMSKISPPGVKALRILDATRNTQASDPRDKIYGVLGFFGASDDKLLLRIKGRKVDFAKLRGQLPSSIGYSNEACIELWRYWWKFASALESYPTGETVADVFKATLCWGSDLAFHRQKPGGYTETFDAWLKVLTGPDDTSTAARHVFNDKEPSKYAHRATAITWGRNLGITDGGYLTMVPITSEVGDEIVIFQGAKLPFVVRTEDGKSKLVGPCYVHGMMDGEFATKDDAPAAGELAWFALC